MTTETHPTPEEIALYVMGATEEVVFPDIEAHLDACPTCRELMAAEAKLELSLHETAKQSRVCMSCGLAGEEGRCTRCGAARFAGRYNIEALMDETPQGRVYIAKDAEGNRVRLKEVVFGQVPDTATLAAFEKEATLLKQLSHPSIPRFVESFQEGDEEHLRLYLAETLMPGEPLSELLDHHRFTESQVDYIARQVLGILTYLHRLSPQVFHRDIRPSTLIMQNDGRVALVDFGSARDLSVTGTHTLAGVAGYAAPEQMVGVVDETSDLYGLGATLCHLLTRRPPVQDEDPLARAHVSERMKRFIRRAMAPSARDRFSSAKEALRFLETPEGRGPRPRRMRLANLWLPTTAVLTAVTSMLLAVVVYQGPPRVAPPPVEKEASLETIRVIVSSNPDRARVTLYDDEGKKVSLPNARLRTPTELAGLEYNRRYRIVLKSKGYRDAERKVFFKPNSVSGPHFVSLKLEPERKKKYNRAAAALAELRPTCVSNPSLPPGFVTINTRPHSRIYLGDRLLGETPLSKVVLPSGCVELTAVTETGVRRSVKIEVEPEKVRIYEFRVPK